MLIIELELEQVQGTGNIIRKYIYYYHVPP